MARDSQAVNTDDKKQGGAARGLSDGGKNPRRRQLGEHSSVCNMVRERVATAVGTSRWEEEKVAVVGGGVAHCWRSFAGDEERQGR